MAGDSVNTTSSERGRGSVLFVDTGHATADSQYAAATGIDVSAADYAPAVPMRGLLCGDVQATGAAAVGDIAVELVGGGQMIIPVSVGADDHKVILRGAVIAAVLNSGTAYTGTIFPLW